MEDIMIMTGVLCWWQERALTAWLSLSLEGILQGVPFFLDFAFTSSFMNTLFSPSLVMVMADNEKCRQKERQATLTIEVQDSKTWKKREGRGVREGIPFTFITGSTKRAQNWIQGSKTRRLKSGNWGSRGEHKRGINWLMPFTGGSVLFFPLVSTPSSMCFERTFSPST